MRAATPGTEPRDSEEGGLRQSPQQRQHPRLTRSESRRDGPWSQPGWKAPSEAWTGLDGAHAWIGGGSRGGVPERDAGGPGYSAKAKDLTALGQDIWTRLGQSPDRTRPSSSSSVYGGAGSSSSSASTFPGIDTSAPPIDYDQLPPAILNLSSVADPWQYDLSQDRFLCRELTECEPCPAIARNHPFCRPYGNRKLVSCRNIRFASAEAGKANVYAREGLETISQWAGSNSIDSDSNTDSYRSVREVSSAYSAKEVASRAGLSGKPRPPDDVDFVGWEACGKVVRNETRDYLEFVMILILLALAGLSMLIRRNRELLHKMREEGLAEDDTDGSAASNAAANNRRRRRRRGRVAARS